MLGATPMRLIMRVMYGMLVEDPTDVTTLCKNDVCGVKVKYRGNRESSSSGMSGEAWSGLLASG